MNTQNNTVALVYNEKTSYLLSKIENIAYHGVSSLKGVYIDSTTWLDSTSVIIPTEKIQAIIEFPSLEKYKENMKEHYAQKAK